MAMMLKSIIDNCFSSGFMDTTEVLETLGCAVRQITRRDVNTSVLAPYLYGGYEKTNLMGLENAWTKFNNLNAEAYCCSQPHR
jgi:hypothetical protein